MCVCIGVYRMELKVYMPLCYYATILLCCMLYVLTSIRPASLTVISLLNTLANLIGIGGSNNGVSLRGTCVYVRYKI
jgi:hypothetical protein